MTTRASVDALYALFALRCKRAEQQVAAIRAKLEDHRTALRQIEQHIQGLSRAKITAWDEFFAVETHTNDDLKELMRYRRDVLIIDSKYMMQSELQILKIGHIRTEERSLALAVQKLARMKVRETKISKLVDRFSRSARLNVNESIWEELQDLSGTHAWLSK